MAITFHPKQITLDYFLNYLQVAESRAQKAGLSAELEVYKTLKNSKYLNKNNYHIFINFRMLNFPGEADFLLIGPDGIFLIEVKSGKYWEYKNNVFYKKGKMINPRSNKKDPAKQAIRVLDEVTEYIKDDLHMNLCFNFLVCFPETKIKKRKEAIDQIEILWGNEIDNFDNFFIAFLQRTKNNHRSCNKLDNNKIDKIINGIVSYYRTEGYFLNVSIVEEIEDVFTTKKQQEALKFYNNNNRMILKGAAGTGKTIILSHIAKLESTKGKKVIYIYYNDKMKNYIKKMIGNDLVDVKSIWDLTKDILVSKNKFLDEKDWNNILTNAEDKENAMEDEIDKNLKNIECFEKYDLVIIDEAQDIFQGITYFYFIEKILKNGWRGGNWILAYDYKQALFWDEEEEKDFNDIISDLRSYSCEKELLEVIRTPVDIINNLHNKVPFTRDINSVVYGGIINEFNNKSFNAIFDEIKGILKNNKEYKNKKYVVLCENEYILNEIKKIDTHNNLFIDIVDNFKGLETDIVFYIVDDLNKIKTDLELQKKAYIAYTRARYAFYGYEIK